MQYRRICAYIGCKSPCFDCISLPGNSKRGNYVGPKNRIVKYLRALLKNVIEARVSEITLNINLFAALNRNQVQSWRTYGEFCRGLLGKEMN